MQHIHVADSNVVYPIMTNMVGHRQFYDSILGIILDNRDPKKETVTIGTGTSGASIGTFLGTMDNTIKYVQLYKKGEGSHRAMVDFSYQYGGPNKGKPWELWLVDDFLSSGSTVVAMLYTLRNNGASNLAGVNSIEGLIAGAQAGRIPGIQDKLLDAQTEVGITIKKWYTV